MKKYRISVEDVCEYVEASNYKEARKKAIADVYVIELDEEGCDLWKNKKYVKVVMGLFNGSWNNWRLRRRKINSGAGNTAGVPNLFPNKIYIPNGKK